MTGATTRWWWVRHAPVVGHDGRIYGQDDFDCDCSDGAAFERLARALPEDAVWVTSHLLRARRTADSILARRSDGRAPPRLVEPALAEQHFGAWQGLTVEELAARREGAWHRFWLAPAAETPPGGESFCDVVHRVSGAIARLSRAHLGRDIVAVTHGGTIRAALVHALGLEPERGLAFVIDHCSLTRLEHIHGPSAAGFGPQAGAPGSRAAAPEGVWRVRTINAAPGEAT